MRILFMLILTGCTSAPPTPWVDATPSGGGLRANFRARIGAEAAGAGVFKSRFADGDDGAHAVVTSPQGAAEPVLVIRMAGRTDIGWNLLELDIAANAWRAGDIAMDGNEAIGLLTRSDGSERIVIGTLVVDEAGLVDGDIVSGTLKEATLMKAEDPS